ncbi:hypothetical protein JTB14_031655 [Gonioctena quinquepunctata]|nr:hypothetical protein JTB14_031655 [Gonioctena quinquepunctata]
MPNYNPSNSLKTEVLNTAKNLKNTGIYISTDYTPEIHKKKYLITQQKSMREKGYSAVIKGFNLVINGGTFSLEGLQELESIGNTQNQEDEVLNEAESSTNRKKEDKKKEKQVHLRKTN